MPPLIEQAHSDDAFAAGLNPRTTHALWKIRASGLTTPTSAARTTASNRRAMPILSTSALPLVTATKRKRADSRAMAGTTSG